MNSKRKTITLDAALNEGPNAPLWVLNTANEQPNLTHPSGADVLITISTPTEPVTVKVERTWIPQCLTEQYPRRLLLESMRFREALGKGLIVLVDTEWAKSVEKTSRYQEEYALLKEIRQMQMTGEATGDAVAFESDPNHVTDRSGNSVSQNLQAFVNRLNTMAPTQAVREIRNRRMNLEDGQYVVDNLKDRNLAERLQRKINEKRSKE